MLNGSRQTARLILISVGLNLLGCRNAPVVPEKSQPVVNTCNRIVSLAPSLTESSYALGLGDKIVGVTRFCDFPEEAKSKTVVGGYVDPNYEVLSSLQPDLVLLLEHHTPLLHRLRKLGLECHISTTEKLSGLLTSIDSIGKRCGVEKTAKRLRQSLETRIAAVAKKTANRKRPRVLVSVGRSMGSGSIKDIFVAGAGTIFDELVHAAGGKNALRGNSTRYARMSREGVMELDPDVIIDLVVDLEKKNLSKKEVAKQWDIVDRTRAVRSGRVHVLGENYVVVPGPRIILLLEKLAELFHPDVDWN